MAGTTWNPSDKSAGITLTGSNLIATNSNNLVSGVRAVDRQITGKFYWEVTFNTVTYTSDAAGIINGSFSLTTGVLSAPLGSPIMGVAQTGSINGGIVGPSLGTITAGSVVCFAVDCSACLIWIRVGAAGNWNANSANNPATGIGGIFFGSLSLGGAYPIYPWCLVGNTNDKMTANFGDTAFTGAVPAGFTSGFTAGTTISTSEVATQVALEEWAGAIPPQMQATQLALEQWIPGTSFTNVQVTQVGVEEWAIGNPAAQVTQVAVEMWTGSGVVPPVVLGGPMITTIM